MAIRPDHAVGGGVTTATAATHPRQSGRGLAPRAAPVDFPVMPEPDGGLPALRQQLGDLDKRIVELIAERFRVVTSVGAEKVGSGTGVRDSDRVRQVLEAVEQIARAEGAPVDLVRRIYRVLLGESVSRQVSRRSGAGPRDLLRVVVQGAEHTAGFLATQKYLSSRETDGEMISARSHQAAVEALKTGDVDLAVLPIENTIAGSINEVYDLLRETDVSIVGEETWNVDHCLAGVSEVPLGAIRQARSDPDGREESSALIQALPRADPMLHFDAGEAMRLVAEAGDPTQVAIGSSEAAAAHGLVVLRHRVANQAENYTRFVVLARHPVAVDISAPCKTSLILVARHEHGALIRSLQVLGSSGHSMTKLESRPRPGRPWEYMFFLDFEGNIGDPRPAGALDDLRSTSLHLKVLGSYPAKATKVEFRPGD